MQTFEIIHLAIGNRAVQVARALGVNRSLVYRHMRAPKNVRFHDFLAAFLRWLKGIRRTNRRGAELLMAHVEFEFAALRAEGVGVASSGEILLQLAECELLRAQVNRHALAWDEAQLEVALKRHQSALARLGVMVRSRTAKRRRRIRAA